MNYFSQMQKAFTYYIEYLRPPGETEIKQFCERRIKTFAFL